MKDSKVRLADRNQRTTAMAGNGGYTLLELMVTVVVFIGISVLAVPSIRGMVEGMWPNRWPSGMV